MMSLDDVQLKKLLLDQHYLEEQDLSEKPIDVPLVDYVLDTQILTKSLLGQALAEHAALPYIDISRQSIDDDMLLAIPESYARGHRVVALYSIKEKGVPMAVVATSNPNVISFVYRLEHLLGMPVQLHFCLDQDIDHALRRYRHDITTEMTALFATVEQSGEAHHSIETVVREILRAAERHSASDIHFDPEELQTRLRFRIDGQLQDIAQVPNSIYDNILSRIKVLSKMRIDEHRSAQDGRFTFANDGGDDVDVRVSIVPTKHFENVVMRLLSSHGKKFTLENIGMRGRDLDVVVKTMAQPHGMILVTGPTGSGKSTTLYSVLKRINNPKIHIATIEDPIEYDIEGVTQIQVNEATNLHFADGLRALVRQDPDVIMVGEIRDTETAAIAVNAALTGHLVLSTLHTNDAPTTLPRLLDMGIEPFLLSSTVSIVVSQRLVRKICTSCMYSEKITKERQKELLEHDSIASYLTQYKVDIGKSSVYQGQGCSVCNHTGYQGRIGLFEVMTITKEIQQAIMDQKHSDEIKQIAITQGMTTMFVDGMDKVFQGHTTLEEVLRVAM